MDDAKRVVPPEDHVENVGQRRPDAESGDTPVIRHPDDRENEAAVEGEGYETARSGAV